MIYKVMTYFFFVLFFLYYIYLILTHMRIKAFLWHQMPDKHKDVINYGFHKFVLFIDQIPWEKRLYEFIQKRNKTLLEFDPIRGKQLIATERKLCILEWMLVISLWLVFTTLN